MDNFELIHPTKNLSLLHKYDTEYCPDSVEFCPHEPLQHFFVCANYQLIEDKTQTQITRLGRILLFSLNDDDLKLHQSIDTDAVLDQKWCHKQIGGCSVLAVVNAKKTLQIYKLDNELHELELITQIVIIDDDSETLLLSLDWSTGKCDNPIEIACSDSKGNIHRFIYEDNQLILENSWNAHKFEAWIVAFDYWDTNIVYTGGDDSIFCKFDKRIGDGAIIKNKAHEAGVTSIHSNFAQEHILATGSYDSYLRIWDARNLKQELNKKQLPGTLWRLKWDPFNCTHLLAACMMGGVHIVNCMELHQLEIIDSFYEHKNLAYGADWCFISNKIGERIIGTCSFYDKLLCISKLFL